MVAVAADPAGTGRRWWAPIGLGAAVCVACCLAPILIAAGVIGGGALLVGLSWLEPLGFILLGVGVAGLIWSRTRRRGDTCGAGSDAEVGCESAGCGCATATTSAGSAP
ncbi:MULTISPECIES: hypothetical protein [Nocardia]|uniref:hypothetical protein n=1 Tax=Nocardia TaxID=1817 RepID=UPI0002DC1554|nr:hypothetical protein [Nocardia arizonensis]